MAMRGEKTIINGVRRGATEYSSLNTKSDRLPVSKRAEDRRCETYKNGRLRQPPQSSISPRRPQTAVFEIQICRNGTPLLAMRYSSTSSIRSPAFPAKLGARVGHA